MEKYARQALSEGLKTAEDLHVAGDSELYRVLNLHYNRNNHIEVINLSRFLKSNFVRKLQGNRRVLSVKKPNTQHCVLNKNFYCQNITVNM